MPENVGERLARATGAWGKVREATKEAAEQVRREREAEGAGESGLVPADAAPAAPERES